MHKSRRAEYKVAWRAKGMLIFLIACILQACNQETLYHTFHNVPPSGWMRKDTICFDVTVCDSHTVPCQLYVEVRNRNDYPYQNLPITLTLTLPDSTVSFNDTLSLTLANKESKWTGKGWGGIYQSSFPISQLQLTQPGNYQFYIQHCLDDEQVKGISDIGIRLDRLHQPPVSSGIDSQEYKQQDGKSP